MTIKTLIAAAAIAFTGAASAAEVLRMPPTFGSVDNKEVRLLLRTAQGRCPGNTHEALLLDKDFVTTIDVGCWSSKAVDDKFRVLMGGKVYRIPVERVEVWPEMKAWLNTIGELEAF